MLEPLGGEVSLRHLPDLSNASFSFQLPHGSSTTNLLAINDESDDFLRGTDSSFGTPTASPMKKSLPSTELKLEHLTPKARTTRGCNEKGDSSNLMGISLESSRTPLCPIQERDKHGNVGVALTPGRFEFLKAEIDLLLAPNRIENNGTDAMSTKVSQSAVNYASSPSDRRTVEVLTHRADQEPRINTNSDCDRGAVEGSLSHVNGGSDRTKAVSFASEAHADGQGRVEPNECVPKPPSTQSLSIAHRPPTTEVVNNAALSHAKMSRKRTVSSLDDAHRHKREKLTEASAHSHKPKSKDVTVTSHSSHTSRNSSTRGSELASSRSRLTNEFPTKTKARARSPPHVPPLPAAGSSTTQWKESAERSGPQRSRGHRSLPRGDTTTDLASVPILNLPRTLPPPHQSKGDNGDRTASNTAILTRSEPSISEISSSVAATSKSASTSQTSTARYAKRKAEYKTHPIPDFKALHAAHDAKMASRRKSSVPTVPLAPRLHTDLRLKEREAFDAKVKERELEMERQREEKRRLREEEEDREIRELRRKAIPKANGVPDWYRDAPKKRSVSSSDAASG